MTLRIRGVGAATELHDDGRRLVPNDVRPTIGLRIMMVVGYVSSVRRRVSRGMRATAPLRPIRYISYFLKKLVLKGSLAETIRGRLFVLKGDLQ